jgi:hypothetical protein
MRDLSLGHITRSHWRAGDRERVAAAVAEEAARVARPAGAPIMALALMNSAAQAQLPSTAIAASRPS